MKLLLTAGTSEIFSISVARLYKGLFLLLLPPPFPLSSSTPSSRSSTSLSPPFLPVDSLVPEQTEGGAQP